MLILHYPKQALEKLEEVSYLLKNEDSLKLQDFLKTEEIRNYKLRAQDLKQYNQIMSQAFAVAKTGDDDDAAEEVASVGYVPDLL
jgi:hypothetical protein